MSATRTVTTSDVGATVDSNQNHIVENGSNNAKDPAKANEPGFTAPTAGTDDGQNPLTGVDVVADDDDDDGDPSGGGGSYYTKPSYDANTNLDMPDGAGTTNADEAAKLRAALGIEANNISIDRLNHYDKQPMVDMATEQVELARQQYNNQIDNSMNTNAAELNRAVADAQSQYQTQQNQVTANEMNALDNAALYAEARGDKGGIGYAQYNAIQNTAAQNRANISAAQTKLATDTARQISDLRAQGEFDKADKALELAQTYLSELRQIEEYAADYNLTVDQTNSAIDEWEHEFNRATQEFAVSTELSLAQLTGMFANGLSTKEAYDTLQDNAAAMAIEMLKAGVEPTNLSKDQLAALQSVYGMSESGINNYYKKVAGR